MPYFLVRLPQSIYLGILDLTWTENYTCLTASTFSKNKSDLFPSSGVMVKASNTVPVGFRCRSSIVRWSHTKTSWVYANRRIVQYIECECRARIGPKNKQTNYRLLYHASALKLNKFRLWVVISSDLWTYTGPKTPDVGASLCVCIFWFCFTFVLFCLCPYLFFCLCLSCASPLEENMVACCKSLECFSSNLVLLDTDLAPFGLRRC